jgi:ATP-independent RNA helicase DbpA
LIDRTNTLKQAAFSSLELHDSLLKNLDTLGYMTMTPIQAESLPYILKGKDVIAQGKTGSGKTAAFGLGLLNKIDVRRFQIQSLVLCPTRELADQVTKEIRRLARAISNIKVLTLCGGTPFRPQADSLEHGAHIIVGTPGRIEDHLGRGTVKLDSLETFILDEADRMLEMGFQSAIENIIEQSPRERQTLLFSATFPAQIKSIAKHIMIDPVVLQVTTTHDDSVIRQHFYEVKEDGQRLVALRLLLLQHRPESTIVFCNTKKEVQEVAGELSDHGFSVLALHGDLEQRDRDQTLLQFSNKSISVLIATDVASRGLDIDSIDLVINYHIARDTEVHIHRIGRTGRSGNKGIACSFYSDKESYKVALLGDYLDRTIEGEKLPPVSLLRQTPDQARMTTILIDGGKKQKVRPGDILGALTGKTGIEGKQVGKIHIFDNRAYVAVMTGSAKAALKKLSEGKLKGRSFRARLLRNN